MRQILASMRNASIFLVAVFGLIGLSGCGTPAYRIAKSECRNLAANGDTITKRRWLLGAAGQQERHIKIT